MIDWNITQVTEPITLIEFLGQHPDAIITTYHDIGQICLGVGLICLGFGYLAACRHYGRL